jgi:hypothetical protein
MTDIVKRLRNKVEFGLDKFSGKITGYPDDLCRKAADEIERLQEALRFMLDNDRNLQKPLEELFAEFCNEARKALGETEPEELGEKE